MFLGIALKRLISLVFLVCNIFIFVIEYAPVTVFIERFRAAVSVLIGPCCPALLNRIYANVYTVVLLGKINDDDDGDDEL